MNGSARAWHLTLTSFSLLQGLFQKDANERLTIPEIKQHPWFKANLPEEMSVSLLACSAQRFS